MSKEAISPRRRLDLFLDQWRDLEDRRLIKEKKLDTLRFNFKIESARSQVTFEETELDAEDWRSFLMAFRHFVMKKEDVYMGNIFTICEEHLADESKRRFLQSARQEWDRIMKHGTGMSLNQNNKELSPQDILSLGFYAGKFHRVDKKVRSLQDWGEFQPVVLNEFKTLVQSITNVIRQMGRFVEKGLDDGWFVFADDSGQ